MKCAIILIGTKVSMEARKTQFWPLQKVEDLVMHYTIGNSEIYGNYRSDFLSINNS